VAPLGLLNVERLRDVTIGGSVWRGRHLKRPGPGVQSTAGGFRFFNPR